jgi:hypothetical protein
VAKHVTIRIPADAWEALDVALATGEGIADAARAIHSVGEPVEQVLIDFATHEVTPTLTKPIALGPPRLLPDGRVSIPVHLRWLKGTAAAGPPWTEATGPPEHARLLVEALEALLAASEAS